MVIEDEGGVLGDERRRMEIKVFDDKEGENSGDDMNKGKLGNKGEDVTKNKGVDEGVDSGGDDENIGKMDVGDVEKEVVREKKGGVKRNKVNFEEIELRRSQRERKLVMQTGFDEELDEYFPEDDRSRKKRKKNLIIKEGEENRRTRARTRTKKEKCVDGGVSYAEQKRRPLTDENVYIQCFLLLEFRTCYVYNCIYLFF